MRGAGIFCLEEYEHAKARGANIIAEIAGYGATGDAYHMTSPSPTGEAAHAMKYAYEEAGLKPEQVNYINALTAHQQVLTISMKQQLSSLLFMKKPQEERRS